MERLLKTLLLITVLALPAGSYAAEIKTFKHVLSVYQDEKEGMFKLPEGIACNDKSDLVVADTGNGRLVRFKYQEGKVSGGTEIKIAEMSYPVRLQMNSKGEILALDEKQRRLVKVSPAGTFAGYLEAQGAPAPAKFVARSFKLDASDNVYLLDIAGDRVLILDAAGKYQRQIPLPKQRGFISDLAVALNGDIFLVDSVNPAIFLAPKGSSEFKPLVKDLREHATFPTYITTDNRGSLFVVDQHGNAIVILGTDGVFIGRRLVIGWKDGQIYYPAQVCLAGSNTIMIADRNNSKVQVFDILK